MARTEAPTERITLKEAWQSFFLGALDGCPEVLDALRERVLPSVPRGEDEYVPAGLLLFRFDEKEYPALTRGLKQWARTYNLFPHRAHVYPIALEILNNLVHQPDDDAKGIGWLVRGVRAGPKLGPIYVPDAVPHRDQTYENYRRRALRSACRALREEGGREDCQLRAAWECAVQRLAAKDNDPSYVSTVKREDEDERLRYEVAARYVCLKVPPSTLAEVYHKDPSVIFRWIQEVCITLQISTRPPGRPSKHP